MKNTKILFALVLLLAALTLCNCHNPSPDPAEIVPPPAETTPAETAPSPAETTPATTTPAETTPTDVGADDTASTTNTLTCKVISPDNVKLKGLKVDVYRIINPPVWVSPNPSIIKTPDYDPNRDFSMYLPQDDYLYSVYTDQNGEFTIELTDDADKIVFDTRYFPKQYGIWHSFGCLDGTRIDEIKQDNVFILERVESASIGRVFDVQHIKFKAFALSKDNRSLYADCRIIDGRFDDNFVDAMITGDITTYRATVVCGDLEVEAKCEFDPAGDYYYWEWRVEYLYYNNYIDKARFDEIFRTTEPSKPLMYM